MKKEKLKEQQQQQQQQGVTTQHQGVARLKSNLDETASEQHMVDHSKSNGCTSGSSSDIAPAGSNSHSKKTFSGIDKEIEQLAQFESKTKKKPSSSVVQTRQAGQQPAGKAEIKLSLNQIKVNQQTSKPTTPSTAVAHTTRNGSQANVPQQPIASFTGTRNPNFSNIPASQGTQVPVSNYSGTVISGPWPSGPESVPSWNSGVEEHQWGTPVAEPQSPWSSVPVAVNSGANATGQYVVRMPQPFVSAANVAGQQFVVPPTPHQQMPHR